MNKRYNGWTNYETWAVKLWIDNDEDSYNYWKEATRECWENPVENQFVDSYRDRAVMALSDCLKDEHDDQSEHPVFKAAEGTVYADLLNAALSEVNWREIAESLIDDAELTELTDETDKDEDNG